MVKHFLVTNSRSHKFMRECQKWVDLNIIKYWRNVNVDILKIKLTELSKTGKKMRKKEICRMRGEYSKRLSSFYISFFPYTRAFSLDDGRMYVAKQMAWLFFYLSSIHWMEFSKKCMIQRKVTKSSHHGHGPYGVEKAFQPAKQHRALHEVLNGTVVTRAHRNALATTVPTGCNGCNSVVSLPEQKPSRRVKCDQVDRYNERDW